MATAERLPIIDPATGAVGYVNTSPEDASYGQPIFQDAYGNFFWNTREEPGKPSIRILAGKTQPGFLSTTPPTSTDHTVTGPTAQQIVDQQGGMTPTSTTPASSTTTSTTGSSTGTQTNLAAAQQQQSQAQLQQLLANPELTSDQRAALQAIYTAVSSNDKSKADQLKAAIAAATQYSEPYFKAQVRLAVDALDRSFQATEGDLSYNENKLRTSLEDLRKDIAASKDSLSFQHAQELKDLERQQSQELETTRDDLAARGFTTSSIRSRKESILNDTYGGLRESRNRSFQYQTDSIQNQLTRGESNTALELQRLRDLAQRGKIDALRQTEERVGSANLPTYAGIAPLGGVAGAIPEAQAKDALSFASQFVF